MRVSSPSPPTTIRATLQCRAHLLRPRRVSQTASRTSTSMHLRCRTGCHQRTLSNRTSHHASVPSVRVTTSSIRILTVPARRRNGARSVSHRAPAAQGTIWLVGSGPRATTSNIYIPTNGIIRASSTTARNINRSTSRRTSSRHA